MTGRTSRIASIAPGRRRSVVRRTDAPRPSSCPTDLPRASRGVRSAAAAGQAPEPAWSERSMLRSRRCRSQQQASHGHVANESTWTSAKVWTVRIYLAARRDRIAAQCQSVSPSHSAANPKLRGRTALRGLARTGTASSVSSLGSPESSRTVRRYRSAACARLRSRATATQLDLESAHAVT